jgi:hypothetical protein
MNNVYKFKMPTPTCAGCGRGGVWNEEDNDWQYDDCECSSSEEEPADDNTTTSTSTKK